MRHRPKTGYFTKSEAVIPAMRQSPMRGGHE
jgi:hypothetical protein